MNAKRVLLCGFLFFSILGGIWWIASKIINSIHEHDEREQRKIERLVDLRLTANRSYAQEKELAILEIEFQNDREEARQSGQNSIAMALAMNAFRK